MFEYIMDMAFIAVMLVYLAGFLPDAFWFTRRVRKVDMSKGSELDPLLKSDWPYIVLFYPVLKELEETMDTTFSSLTKIEYPKFRFKVVAIPNANDHETIASLKRLQKKYPFIELVEVPATTDPSWNKVWNAWDHNPHAYWWTKGKRAMNRNLPPKKTRQLIYAFYQMTATMQEDFLVDYIDADSCPPKDHFIAAALGMRQGFDVLQSQNVAGNLNESMAATLNSADHFHHDGFKYPHQSSGSTPFWVLGKGLFFKSSDLVELGGFNPWVTIEDPEVGMRFWKNGRKLGIIEGSLIEEVPNTFKKSLIQRKRWVAGFFQSLTAPLSYMNYTFKEKVLAWMIFMPCLSLMFNIIGLPISAWQTYAYFSDISTLPEYASYLSLTNLALLGLSLSAFYINTWKRTRLVLTSFWARVYYMLRINPVFIMLWWFWWTVPLTIGFYMFLRDKGLVWERTEKLDKNRNLVYERIQNGTLGYDKSHQPLLTVNR